MARTGDPRKKIVEGAIAALSSAGVTGATTRKIAEAAGVGLAQLHYYFKDKDEILFEVMKSITLIHQEFLDKTVKAPGQLHDCVEDLIQSVWDLVSKTRELQILQFELTMYAARKQSTAWLAEMQYAGYVEQYSRILARNGGHGIDFEQIVRLSRFILAGLDGIIIQELAKSDALRSQASLRTLIAAARRVALDMGAANQAAAAR